MKPRVGSTLGKYITYPMPDYFARKNLKKRPRGEPLGP
jgi:hypothetical protein